MAGQYAKKQRQRTGKSIKLDFSPTAIRREVARETLQKPYVLYPVAVAVLGALASVLLGPSLLFSSALIGGSLAGLGSWILDTTLRKETHVAQHLNDLRSILAKRVKDSIHNLKRDLTRINAQEGLNQLTRLQDKYTVFQELLRGKLNKNELTYNRYLGMTEQVYLAGLDNLNSIAAIMKSISAMDTAHIQGRSRELEQVTNPNTAEKKELTALQARDHLRLSQQQKVRTLLSQNEEAMTTMDKLMAALAEMDSGLSRATMDMESAMQELERLTLRAKKY